MIPFIPNFIAGKNTSHTKVLALIGITDHINVSESIKLIRNITIIPNRIKKKKQQPRYFASFV